MQRNTLAALIAGLFTLPVQAQDIPLLDEILVTATRTPQFANATLAANTIIKRAEIERSQAKSVQELLAGLPGIGMTNSGGAGKLTSIFLRGTQSGHVLVLIDGFKVGSATVGTVSFQDYPVDQIERIEIVRGPLSSLYGSEAIGGVIQIFTRKGGGASSPSASVGIGSYGTQQAAAGFSGGGINSWFNLNASHFRTEGFDACKGSLSLGCFTVEPDKDGYRSSALNLRGGHRFAPGTELDLHLLRAEGKNEFDGGFQNESESVQQVLGASLKHHFNEVWNTRLSLGQSHDELDNFKNGVYSSTFDTQRDSVNWQNDLTFAPRQKLTLGIDYQEDKVTSNTAYTVSSRDNTGVFAQYLVGAGAHDAKLSLRHDDNSQFGGNTTGNAAWGMDMGGNLRGTLSYGTAFKAPTFNDLYYPPFPGSPPSSNPNLLPEKSKSLEVGLAGKYRATHWGVNIFETRIADLIVLDQNYTPTNNDNARIRGIEATSSAQIAGWKTALNLTLQDPENRSNANQGKQLSRRAKEMIRLDLDRRFGGWNLGATVRAEGKRYDDLVNTVKLAGYCVVDLRTEYKIDKAWQLQGKLENLFDKEYETAASYNQPGRGLYLTLRYQP
jgi:vitamin B12 transporter